MTTPATARLDYGATPGRRRVLRLAMRVPLAALVLWAGFAGWKWGIPYATAVWEQSRYLSMQRRWATHVDAPDLVAFDTDPAEAARLKSAGYGNASIPSVGGYDPPRPSAGFRGGAYDELDRSFRPRGGAGGWAGGGVLLRRLRSPGGVERFVLVAALLRQTPPDGVNAELWWLTSAPATLRPGTRVGPERHGKIQPYLRPGERVRVYAAQPDPADASHFTAGYDVAGVAGTIDGRLRDDGTLDLQVRDGPLKGRQ